MHRPALRLLPLCLAIACATHAQAVQARDAAPATWDLCPDAQTLPLFRPLSNAVSQASSPADEAQLPTDIDGESIDISQQDVTVLSGNVQMQRGDQWLGTDKLTYRHDTERFHTDGQVKYQDDGLRFTADRAEGDQKADRMQLQNVRYQFSQQLGNGTAESLTMVGKTGTLEDGTYSTCPPGQRQWEFTASRIDVDQETAMGTSRT